MKLKEVLEKSTQFLKNKGSETPRLDAEMLLAHGLGLQRIDIYLKFDYPLSESEANKARELVVRRGKGEPVAYITNKKSFYKEEFFVDNRVLVPRPETEIIVDEALKIVSERQLAEPIIIDLGCGSGCIGLSLAKELPKAQIYLIDVSASAIEVAKINAEKLGVSDRCQFVIDDVTNLKQVFSADIVVANPPYIANNDPDIQTSVREFEPSSALFGGELGTEIPEKFMLTAAKCLRPGGVYISEINSKHREQTQGFVQENTLFCKSEVKRDFSDLDRVFIGEVKNG